MSASQHRVFRQQNPDPRQLQQFMRPARTTGNFLQTQGLEQDKDQSVSNFNE